VAADLTVLALSLYAAIRLFAASSQWLSLQDILNVRPRLRDMLAVGGILLGWIMLFQYFGLYRQRYMSFMRFRPYHFVDMIKATALGTLLLLIGAAFLVGLEQITTWLVLKFWVIVTLGTLLTREVLNLCLRELRLQGRNLRHLLIVGTNDRAQELAKMVKLHPELGYALRGFVDDDWKKDARPKNLDASIVAGLDGIDDYLRNNVVDEVVITLPLSTLYNEASRIVELCEKQGVVVHFVPGFGFLNLGSASMMFSTLQDEPIITIVPPAMSGWQLIGKRAMDIAGSVFLMIVLLPLLIVIPLLIKLNSPGPILFAQERLGLNKRKFRLLKFRTMVTNAEELQKTLEHLNEIDGPVFKIKNDPRITPIGKFLRQTSLDELPQLYNVFKGDMSLVGPRPLPLRDCAGFNQDWHRRRFSVRPGVTCLWQISGRSSITFEKWMELDMAYINQWSLWLDLKILAATVPAILKQRGAV
jgi:exopolysaccharide biosynthesis polyprenyl glycosylphosphotransferase